MKIRIFAVLLIMVLMLAGCGAALTDAAGEDTAIQTAHRVTTPTQSTPITREQAEAIALEHAGFTADQVTRLRTEYEVDDGVPRYEVQFRQGRWEYDYEINADTGAIISYDRDT